MVLLYSRRSDRSTGSLKRGGCWHSFERMTSRRWYAALGAGVVALVPLVWLLARVVWIPAYFGVFFFIIGGMLAGAIPFRMARSLRPVPRGRVIFGVVLLACVASVGGLYFEYRYRADEIGAPPRFAQARTDAVSRGDSARSVSAEATAAFEEMLQKTYPPGGPIGYCRWAAGSGTATLALARGFSDEVTLGQRRAAWMIRTVAAYGLFVAGLWYQLEALRRAGPVSNILAPGEEAEDA